MSLVHHLNSTTPYEDTAKAASEQAKTKLQAIINKGKEKALNTLQSIKDEYEIRRDLLAPASAITYDLTPEGVLKAAIREQSGEQSVGFTNHALAQLYGRVNMPKTFADKLSGMNTDWTRGLLLHNLRELTDGGLGADRLLFRVIKDTVKGVLSSAYRRMDASPIFETFLDEGLKNGLVPVDGVNTDSRYHVKMLMERIYEPAPHEVVCFGMSLTTSDYGAAALQMQFFLMRLWCTNFAIGEDSLKRIHLGKRFTGDDGEDMVLSQQTYDLDTKAVASAVKDIMSDGMNKKADDICTLIAHANEKGVDVKEELARFRKKGLLDKAETEAAQVLYDAVGEIIYLPQNKSAWRFSNVLSLMAQSAGGDKKIDLERAAMEVLK